MLTITSNIAVMVYARDTATSLLDYGLLFMCERDGFADKGPRISIMIPRPANIPHNSKLTNMHNTP